MEDPLSGLEHGQLDPRFHPTSDNSTGLAFATLESQLRNTETGKRGIFCAACHSMADTREMPFGQHNRSGAEAAAIPGAGEAGGRSDRHEVPDPSSPTLGYAVGAGSYRMSPKVLATSQFLGSLAAAGGGEIDPYLSGVFGVEVPVERGAFEGAGHTGAAGPLQQRGELCGTCHDVTNALPIKNRLGRWVGGFPIERTYTEWASSRYADRPGNVHFDARFKRDCQTCHMQQDYGQPGTAAAAADSRAPLRVRVTNSGSGHNFPFGFPEGRNAWIAVRAFDLATGRELPIHDAVWRRTSLGVGLLTAGERADPNFPACGDHKLPAGSPDPFAVQFRAVASLGDGCPTLELPYATPLNLTVGRDGLPVDVNGRAHRPPQSARPAGLPRPRRRWRPLR